MTNTGVSMAALERAVAVINGILSKAQGVSAKGVPLHNKKKVASLMLHAGKAFANCNRKISRNKEHTKINAMALRSH